jgi:hypothetical protein
MDKLWFTGFLLQYEVMKQVWRALFLTHQKDWIENTSVKTSEAMPTTIDAWREYCHGVVLKEPCDEKVSDENTRQDPNGAEPDALPHDTDMHDTTPTKEAPRSGQEPNVDIMQSIDQRTTIKLLRYHSLWLSTTDITELEVSPRPVFNSLIQVKWIFSLLLHLGKLLEPEQVYTLRRLAGRLEVVLQALQGGEDAGRFTYNKSDPRVAGVYMCAAVIGGSFGQLDLVRH